MNDDTTKVTNENEEGLETHEEETKTYTQEEVLALLQSEADKRVSDALKKQQKKHDKELAKEKELAKLDGEQRVIAEDKIKIAELQSQLEQLQLAGVKADMAKQLNDRGLDANLVDFVVVSTDTDECIANMDKLDKIFKSMVKAEIEKRIGTTTPSAAAVGTQGGITRDQFKKMSIAEQTALYEKDKELYMQLTK